MRKLIKRGYKPINCIRLYKKGSNFYISFVYHKNTTKDFMFKTFFKDDKILGIDLNFQNFMSLSDGSHISPKFEKYNKIKRKKKNSKNFNNLKKEIQKEAYEKLKSINFSKYSCIVIDDYFSNGFSDVGNNENKLKRWTLDYEKKLKDLCEENGVQFVKVNASFIRDITCPECGKKHKTNSKAIHKAFQEGFKCNYCNHYFLPDVVEAINKVKNNNTQRIHNTFAQQKKTKQLKKQNYGEFKLLKYLKSIKWLFHKPNFVLTKFIDKLINIDEYFNNQYFYNSIKYIYKLKTS
ncbi:MAG: zinc ribbon domain-containing protein [Nanoarchaeota archaeon]